MSVNAVEIDPERSVRAYKLENTPSPSTKGIVVYTVNEVYIYIPAEHSAAGFELKIAGSVKITDKDDNFFLSWSPSDLTQRDVASLYLTQADNWMVVTEIVEDPVVIDVQELDYPDKDYRGGNLELPDPIVPQLNSPDERSKVQEIDTEKINAEKSKKNAHFSIEDESVLFEPSAKAEAVNFPLSDLHSVRGDKRSLSFFLTNGKELPILHFHDGGTTGLLQALQRYMYLEKDPQIPFFYHAKSFNKSQSVKILQRTPAPEHPPKFKTITPSNFKGSKASEVIQEAVSGVVGNFFGITRTVRQHLLPDKQLLDVRPGTENDDDDLEETIQTCVMSDVKPDSSSPSPTNSPNAPPLSVKPKPSHSPPPSRTYSESSSRYGSDSRRLSEVDPDSSLITDYQLITDIRGKLPPQPAVKPRQPPVTSDEWERLRDDLGRLTPDKEQFFRARVFAGGIENKLRKEAWKYLVNYYPFEMTDIERIEMREKKEKEYWSMKQQWMTFTPSQVKRFTRWREVERLINKDVFRTDRDYDAYKSPTSHKLDQLEDVLRTYAMYNFDLGYVQGMSDLLAPLLVVMDNEVDAFWCFVGFMDMVEHHFEMSQEGMRTRLKQLRALLNITDPKFYQFLKDKDCNNLYFCFRWLIVHYKREFSYEDVMSLWEVLWTNFLSLDYSLFIALAILERERESLLNQNFDFSDILQHINRLSKSIPLSPVLELAESLCYQLGSLPGLPDDLQTLIRKPLPSRVAIPQVEHDTIVCKPDSRSVPST